MKYFLLLFILISCDKLSNKSEEQKPFRIVIADSFFCYYEKHPNIKIINHDSSTSCAQFDVKHGEKFHGHFVIKKLIESLKVKRNLEIHLFSVFESDVSNKDSWSAVINFTNTNSIDLFLSAAALKNITLPLFFKDNTIVLLSAGQTGRMIKPTDKLYPQTLPHIKKLLFGHYFSGKSGNYLDNTLLNYEESIVLVESPNSQQTLTGSSYAVVEGTASLLNTCLDNTESINLYDCMRNSLGPFNAKNSSQKNLFTLKK